jgi:hypothetical protein
MQYRIRPWVVLLAFLDRIFENHVVISAAHRVAKRRRAGITTIQSRTDRDESPARPTDDGRPAHDLAQLAEGMKNVWIRAGQRRAHSSMRGASCIWLTTAAPHVPRQNSMLRLNVRLRLFKDH